jgi:hypothetical protein
VSTPTDFLVQVERGHADPEELAALVSVLLARVGARATASGPAGDGTPGGPTGPDRCGTPANWHNPDRGPYFHAPHSWQR